MKSPSQAFMPRQSKAVRDAVGGHHVAEADRGVLRALPLVDGLLDADVGRADGQLAEAAAARVRGRRRSSPSPANTPVAVAVRPLASVTSSGQALAGQLAVARGAGVLDLRVLVASRARSSRRPTCSCRARCRRRPSAAPLTTPSRSVGLERRLRARRPRRPGAGGGPAARRRRPGCTCRSGRSAAGPAARRRARGAGSRASASPGGRRSRTARRTPWPPRRRR